MPNFTTQPGSRKWASQFGKCFYCRVKLVAPDSGNSNGHHPHLATIDHIRLRSEGGKRNHNNVVLACQRCNVLRGTTQFELFVAALPTLQAMGLLGEIASMRGVKPLNNWKDTIYPNVPDDNNRNRRKHSG